MDLKMTKFALLSEGKRYFFQYCVISTCGVFSPGTPAFPTTQAGGGRLIGTVPTCWLLCE